MAAGAQTGSEYIKHHLTNWTFGKDPSDGVWKIAVTAQQAQEMGFYAIHLDSMGWSVALGFIFILLFSFVIFSWPKPLIAFLTIVSFWPILALAMVFRQIEIRCQIL